MVGARPTVSVVVPCYNHARFVAEAICSALEQNAPPDEVIVVDDGSTDDSAAVIRRFGKAVRCLHQPNMGLSTARNVAVRAAGGDIVQLLDADDRLEATTLERMSLAASRTPQAAVLYGSWTEIDADGRPFVSIEAHPLPADAFHALFSPLAIGPPSRFVFRRAELSAVGLFDAGLQSCEDWDLWLRAAAAGLSFAAVPEARVYYRNHPTSMSKNYRTMWESGLHVLQRASSVHVGCGACAHARRRAVREWRTWCYGSMLAPQLREHWRRGQAVPLARACAAALRGDPGLLPYVARSAMSGPRHHHFASSTAPNGVSRDEGAS